MSNQLFFFTENPSVDNRPLSKRLPLRNTLNYMNKFTISENDQFEIAGFFVLDNPTDRKRFDSARKIRWRNEIEGKINEISKMLTLKLSTCIDVVNFFLSGNSLFKSETGTDL